MQTLAVIPARYASSRFPGKPLALIAGRPMIQWVYEATQSSGVFDAVMVATDHQAIAETVTRFGGRVAWTRSDHATGTDRVAEVAATSPGSSVIANVQGDQPFVTAEILRALIQPFQSPNPPEMTTVACPLATSGHQDPNTVKVLLDQQGNALYFTRSAVPTYRERHPAPVYHHLGLYAFRRDFLLRYPTLSPTPLERCEQLEQLRVLEHGLRIGVTPVSAAIPEVNTPEDLDIANQWVSARKAG